MKVLRGLYRDLRIADAKVSHHGRQLEATQVELEANQRPLVTKEGHRCRSVSIWACTTSASGPFHFAVSFLIVATARVRLEAQMEQLWEGHQIRPPAYVRRTSCIAQSSERSPQESGVGEARVPPCSEPEPSPRSHVYHDPDLFDHCSKECNGHSCKKDRNQVGGKKDGHEVCIPRGTTRPCQGHATAMPGA